MIVRNCHDSIGACGAIKVEQVLSMLGLDRGGSALRLGRGRCGLQLPQIFRVSG